MLSPRSYRRAPRTALQPSTVERKLFGAAIHAVRDDPSAAVDQNVEGDETRSLVRRWVSDRNAQFEWTGDDFDKAFGSRASLDLDAIKQFRTAQGEGSFGMVAVYRAEPAVLARLDELRREAKGHGNFVAADAPGVRSSRARPPPGSLVAVKVQSLSEPGSVRKLSALLREPAVHAYLSTSKCRRAPDGHTWCASDVVPRLYWHGQIRNVGITVMEGVAGGSLWREPHKDKFARALENAALTLWAYGVIHNDLHLGNVMVDGAGGLKIIDFGYAAYAPRLAGQRWPAPAGSRRQSSSASVGPRGGSSSSSSVDTSLLYRSGSGRLAPTVEEMRASATHARVQRMANDIMRARGQDLYHSNVTQLRTFQAPPPSAAPRRAGGDDGRRRGRRD